MSTNPSPFTDLRKSIVQDIMSKIVSPNMGWSSDSNQAYEARLEIGDAIEELLNYMSNRSKKVNAITK